MRRLVPAISAALLAALLASTLGPRLAEAQDKNWEEVRRENGVIVWQRTLPDRDMPIFRGQTVIGANIYLLLAILADFDNHCQWMHGCHTAKLLEARDDHHRISYNRTDAPWPIDDRDVVLESHVEVHPDAHKVRIRFASVQSPLMPEVDGVVRMNRLRGYYELVALGPDKTRVQYQVDTDPGGYLPDWVVAMASEDIPVNTLTNLRKRAKAVAGRYDDFIARWNPAQNPDAPKLLPD